MALVSGTLETCEHMLETCEASHIGRPVMLFFIHEAHIPLGTVGHVATTEPSPTWRRGLKL
jgi:hypothetical protein